MADVTLPTRGDLRLHVQRLSPGSGTGPITVVFLHGLVMDNLSSWYFTVATQASRLTDTVLYDLRGHGLSSRPPTGYTLADMRADLVALLDTVDPDHTRSFVLVGNSFGGLLALDFARKHPTRTAGLALIDGHLGNDGFGAAMAQTLRLDGEARDTRIASSFKHWLGRHSERKRTRLADAARALVDGTTLVADMARTPPLDAAALAPLARTPILALYGEHSDLRAAGERTLAALPSATVSILPGCTHSVLWEATDTVRARILAFISQVIAR